MLNIWGMHNFMHTRPSCRPRASSQRIEITVKIYCWWIMKWTNEQIVISAIPIWSLSQQAENLGNPESNRSKFVGMFIKLCLESGCNLVGVDSAVREKSNDHFLIILYHKQIFNEFSCPEWKKFLESDTIKSNLIYLAFRRLHIVEIYCHERQTLYLSAWGVGMKSPTRR
jgi:hypothetical protein